MKNEKLLLGLFLSILSVTAKAQIKSDTIITVEERTDKYVVETNRFFDNWFFGFGGGMQLYMGDHNRQMKIEDRLTPAATVFVGKWFSPGIGVRLNLSGGEFHGSTQNGSYSNGSSYDPSQELDEQIFKAGAVRGDVLFNMSNIVLGYKEKRVYNLIPYAGLGWAFTNEARELTANIGLLNSFRLSSAWDFNIDISAGLVNDRFDGEIGGAREEGFMSATVGFTYKFKNRKWNRAKTKTISTVAYTSAMPINTSQVVYASEAEACDIPEAQNTINTINNISPVIISFVIDKSELRNEAKQNLMFLAESLKEINSGVFLISGYADKWTGSAERNETLSRERAEIVYQTLVEYGVPEVMLQYESHGGVENMFFNDPSLSRAVIIKSLK